MKGVVCLKETFKNSPEIILWLVNCSGAEPRVGVVIVALSRISNIIIVMIIKAQQRDVSDCDEILMTKTMKTNLGLLRPAIL